MASPHPADRHPKLGFADDCCCIIVCTALDVDRFVRWELESPELHTLWDRGEQPCFSNAQPTMPFAFLIHMFVCTSGLVDFYNSPWHDALTKLCLFGDIILLCLAARAMSGWWAAGVAAAYSATSPLLFALDKQPTPASLGVFAGALSCWLAIEAFAKSNRRASFLLRCLWGTAGLLALSLDRSMIWLVLPQALYGLSRTRSIPLDKPVLASGIAFAIVATVVAFLPSAEITAAIVRADVRALPVNIFAFSYPDEWLAAPHMATYLSLGFVLMLVCGSLAARSTVLPYLLAGMFAQVLLALSLADGTLVKMTALAYAVILMALSIGSLTTFLIERRPHMLAVVVPTFAVAAQYAAFVRLPLLPFDIMDFDTTAPPPIPMFAAGDHAVLYHDSHHGERMTVHQSLDGYVNRRDELAVAADTLVTVQAVIPYRVNQQVSYAYQVLAENSGLKWFVPYSAMWIRPNVYQCVRQRYSKVRLYDIPNPAFREDGHSVLEPPNTLFSVLEVQDHPYEPELHVEMMDGVTPEKTGWIYAQILLLGSAAETDRAMHFPCS